MKQQINLYSEAFEPVKIPLPLGRMIVINLVVIFICIFINMWMKKNLMREKQQLEDDKVMTENIRVQVDQDRELAKVAANTKQLDQVINDKQLYLSQMRVLLGRVTTEVTETELAFHTKLQSLSASTVSGLWLTEINLSSKGLSVKGTATNSDLIPLWLNGLSETEGLKNMTFSKMEITELDNGAVNFELSNM